MSNSSTLRDYLLLTVFIVMLLAYYYFGGHSFSWFVFPIGSSNAPSPSQLLFWQWWSHWSLPLIVLFSAILLSAKNFSSSTKKWIDNTSHLPIIFISFMGFLSSIFTHFVLIQEMFLTDDESAYLFMADLLNNGRLRNPAPELKMFFDRTFMINDEHFFPQYFYGWPIILSVGKILGLEAFVNPLLHSLSIVLLFHIIRLKTNSLYGYLGAIALCCSPLMMVNAASFLTHTSSTFFVLAATLMWIHIDSTPNTPLKKYFWLALLACIAVHIRPFTAILLFFPMGIHILLRVRHHPHPIAAISIMGATCLVMGAFLLALNYYLNGSVFTHGYNHYFSYASSNNFIYSFWNHSATPSQTVVESAGSTFNITQMFIMFYYGLLRLIYDGAMLPSFALGLVIIAVGFRKIPWMSTSILFLVLGYAHWNDIGIDTYGPVHLSEAVPLLIILMMVFAHQVSLWFKDATWNRGIINGESGVAAIVISTLVLALMTHSIFRLNHARIIADHIATPYEAIANNGIHNAVIFTAPPFAPALAISPLRHFRFWRDNPSVQMDDNILWVNNFGSEKNKAFMKLHPNRSGYEMHWSTDQLNVIFKPLD